MQLSPQNKNLLSNQSSSRTNPVKDGIASVFVPGVYRLLQVYPGTCDIWQSWFGGGMEDHCCDGSGILGLDLRGLYVDLGIYRHYVGTHGQRMALVSNI